MKLQKGPPPSITAQRAKILRVNPNTTDCFAPKQKEGISARQIKHFGNTYEAREKLPGEALPRTHNQLKNPETYQGQWAEQSRPGANDFLSIKSRGF